MRPSKTFESVAQHERFRLTARVTDGGYGWRQVQLRVEEKESGAGITLERGELMPLLGAIKHALKTVEDSAAGLPSDPVERAARRIPGSGMAMSMHRGHIIRAYNEEMAELRERWLQRIDGITARSNEPRPPAAEPSGRPPSPDPGEGDSG